MLLTFIDKIFARIVSILPSQIKDNYPEDKVKHVLVGVIIGCFFGTIAYYYGFTLLFAIYSAAFIGAAKELYDAIHNLISTNRREELRSNSDIVDFAATVLGGVIAWGVLQFLLLLI